MDNLKQYLPDNALNQFSGLATSPEGKDHTCPVCGYFPAKAITLGNKTRYIRQSCPCEIAKRKREEQEEFEREQLYHFSTRTYSWLGERWRDLDLRLKRFDNFKPMEDWQQDALDVTRLFLDTMKGTLVMYGTYGTGKTHLLAALCNEYLREKKKPSLFTTAPKLFSAIQGRIQAKEDYSQLLTSAINTPLLVIDDIDKAKHTEFREEIYFEIVDERVKAGRPMAISTNKLDTLAEYVGGAVCSRLKVGQMPVEMVGADFREEL